MMNKLAVLVFLLTVATAAQSSTVYIDPVSQTVNLGDTVSIALKGQDFSQTIEGGGINLSFDPTVLQLTNVTVDDTTWEFFTTPGTINNTTGHLTDLTFSSFAGNSGSFSIAQITFQATGLGTSPLVLTESTLNPFASGGSLLTPAVSFANAEIQAVPLPAAMWLFFSGMGTLSFFGKRKANPPKANIA